MLCVDEGEDAAAPLRLGDHVVDECRLTGRLRPEDLDDAAAREAADPEREVERQRSSRDRSDRHRGTVAHLHDGALAERPLDLPEGGVESLLAIQPDQPPSANDSRTSYCAPDGDSRDRKTDASDGPNSPISGSGGRRRGA